MNACILKIFICKTKNNRRSASISLLSFCAFRNIFKLYVTRVFFSIYEIKNIDIFVEVCNSSFTDTYITNSLRLHESNTN